MLVVLVFQHNIFGDVILTIFHKFIATNFRPTDIVVSELAWFDAWKVSSFTYVFSDVVLDRIFSATWIACFLVYIFLCRVECQWKNIEGYDDEIQRQEWTCSIQWLRRLLHQTEHNVKWVKVPLGLIYYSSWRVAITNRFSIKLWNLCYKMISDYILLRRVNGSWGNAHSVL